MPKHTEKAILLMMISIIGIFVSPRQITHAPTSSLGNATTTLDASTWYPVVRVVDGDTIDVKIGSKRTRVRLIGLDTPESVDPRRPVQCFAKQASDELKKILNGQSVRLETDPSQDRYDKYGRLLAYVFAPANVTPSGILINKYMIAEGFGHEYTYDRPYKYQKEFKAAEIAARIGQKGLWAPTMCNGDTKKAAS